MTIMSGDGYLRTVDMKKNRKRKRTQCGMFLHLENRDEGAKLKVINNAFIKDRTFG